MLRRHLHYTAAQSTHFITLVTRERGNWFVGGQDCEAILKAFEFCRARTGVACLAYVLMPDHLHALLVQPEEGSLIPKLVQDFKKYTSRKLRPDIYHDRTLWSERYDDVPVPGSEAVLTKLHYIHMNPVRRGLVNNPDDYLWSSAGDYSDHSKGIVTIELVRGW
jgi:putative transposase